MVGEEASFDFCSGGLSISLTGRCVCGRSGSCGFLFGLLVTGRQLKTGQARLPDICVDGMSRFAVGQAGKLARFIA